MRLAVPKGNKTRPTADRVRESLFNILGERVVGARVLDLFAGSGALGIEALSRGANHAVFVDQEPGSIAVIRSNLVHTSFEEAATVIRARLPRHIPLGTIDNFDIIFMDPPYQRGWVAKTLALVEELEMCSSDGVVVVEHSCKEEIPSNLKNLKPLRRRLFGETAITLLDRVQQCE